MKRLILIAVVLSVGISLAGWRGRFDEQFAAASTAVRLPAEYQAVEYLESTGTQYIDTGYKLGYNSKVGTKYINTGDTAYGVFGARTSVLSECFLGFSNERVLLRVDFGNIQNVSGLHLHNNFLVNATISVDGVYINGNFDKALTTTPPFVCAYPASLFAVNNSGNRGFLPLVGKIYFCKFWESNTPVRDFVPAVRKDDSVAGMYDLVSKQFFTNQGTGEFVVGPNIED